MVFAFGVNRDPIRVDERCQWPQQLARQARFLAKFSRGLERSVLEYVSTGPQRKRSQGPGSAGVVTGRDESNDEALTRSGGWRRERG